MARRLLVALGLVLALVVCGCTWSSTEPGLFRPRAPSPVPGVPPPSGPRSPPTGGNPDLPVAGELVWTSGEGLRLTTRFAVHAVRRIPGATVLDYSVTPLAAPGLHQGDDVPGWAEFGLDSGADASVGISLLDPTGHRVYRNLSHTSRRQFHHCLCSPLWAAQLTLRLGETRLLQATFPALPADLGHVDVLLANQAPVAHVPVTPVGSVPTRRRRVDLSRPAAVPAAGAARFFDYPGQGGAAVSVTADRVTTGPGGTTLQWTFRSLSDRFDYRAVPLGTPFATALPGGVRTTSTNTASGPTLRPAGGGPVRAVSWTTATVAGEPGLDCLCSRLGVWARSLGSRGGAVQLSGLYPALAAGTSRVEVRFVGLAPVSLPVHTAADAASRLGPPTAAPVGSWTYTGDAPPIGWSPQDWPTPPPDPWQLVDYRGAVADVRTLPPG